ncbi:MAG TPA: nucleotide exchange factor GrpE [Anaerolineales bacterium]|jgi:molecular chaperone GrpE
MHDKKHKSKEQAEESQAGEPVFNESSQEVELAELKSELAESKVKAQEYLEALQRERAGFMNFRRRTDQDNAVVGRLASGSTIKKFLSGIDDLERALAHRPADDVWADGIELVYRKFLSILESEGVTRMDALGQPFDPNLHEAIMQEPSDQFESGRVTTILQHGYMHGERVLRPALVKVAQ